MRGMGGSGRLVTGNDRRRLTRAERRADDAGTVMMLGFLAAAWGCAAFVAGVVVALAGWGVRAW